MREQLTNRAPGAVQTLTELGWVRQGDFVMRGLPLPFLVMDQWKCMVGGRFTTFWRSERRKKGNRILDLFSVPTEDGAALHEAALRCVPHAPPTG